MKKSTKRYHHGDLRAAIVVKAIEMIAENGVESVTMRGLGQQLGVSRAAPYRHFAGKIELLTAVAAEGFSRLQTAMETAAAQDVELLIRYYKMGAAYIQFAIDNPTLYRLLLSEESLNRENSPNLAAAADDAFATLQRMIEQCQAANLLKAGDPCLLAYATWAMVHGVASLIIDGQLHDEISADELVQFAYQALAGGVVA
ncbi:MAG: TetR/AcrR family transcriptional regulator [Chloroflexi bacterium]|nr:TetR/AcrR family transcriptional regulator [Chloroflexota bacterium]